MTPRRVLLCAEPETMGPNKPLTPAERSERYRKNHPERIRANRERFIANNPNYHRDYWRRRNGKAA